MDKTITDYTSPMMKNKITLFYILQLVVKRFNTQLSEPTNQIQ